MNEELKKLYAEILVLQKEVCFWDDRGRLCEIKEYDGEDGGYMVEVFENEAGCFEATGGEKEVLTHVECGQMIEDKDGYANPVWAIDFAMEL
jgi:hypothetical protein